MNHQIQNQIKAKLYLNNQIPKKLKDIDRKYDIEIRKICLEHLIKNFNKFRSKPQKSIKKLHYYLAHPVIRKLASIKMRVK